MEGVSSERRPTLSEHMAAVSPPNNLRHLLTVRDATDASSTSRPGLTLGSVLGIDKLPAPVAAPAPSRTLLDIIREEENVPASGRGGGEGQKITWRSLKDRLLLRRMAGRQAADGAGRVSLFSLLEQEDRHAVPGEEEEEGEEESRSSSSAAGEGGGEYGCCVCMARHKGAAFIPCGHTFCRVCSRELWVSRGNCPLCNGYILEILDIF